MPDESQPRDPATVWKGQPAEDAPVKVEQFAERRARELDSNTRAEVLMSIGAAVFFIATVAWRLAADRTRIPEWGIGAVSAWILISLFWFRHRIWRKNAGGADGFAAT